MLVKRAERLENEMVMGNVKVNEGAILVETPMEETIIFQGDDIYFSAIYENKERSTVKLNMTRAHNSFINMLSDMLVEAYSLIAH